MSRQPNGAHDEAVRRLWPLLSVEDVARSIRKHRRTVERIARRLNLPAKRETVVEGNAIIRQYWLVESTQDIARRVGMTDGAVRTRAARLGLPPRRPGRPTGPLPPHATVARWCRGCRCGRCLVANRDHRRLYQATIRGHRIERLADGAALVYPKPRKVRAAWRCYSAACDGRTITHGATCHTCGAPAPWATDGHARMA